MTAKDVVSIAVAEEGYLEKATNAQLDSKTANAGKNNFTKYGAWYGVNGQPWCAMFVSWVFYVAGLLYLIGGKWSWVPSMADWFKIRGQYFARGAKPPQAGDIIFFGSADHVGLVEYVSGNYVHTIEGNTSGGSTLITNGGAVCRKCYHINSSYIMGYGRPKYEDAPVEVKTEERYNPWRSFTNGSSETPVYADTDRTEKIGSLDPKETCECLGRYGDSYAVSYKKEGTADNWKIGYVGYNGIVN